VSIVGFFLSLALVWGCGAPGEPTPPAPQIARAVTDLSGHQAGDGVQLRFTLPSKTIRGEPLSETPAVEILRGAVKTDGSPDAKSFRQVQTVPGALVENYRADDQVQVTDTVPTEELPNYPGRALAYRVRTRATRRRASADSNTVVVRVLPVAERITSLRATPTETAIELTWTPPTPTSAGEPVAAISEYHIYRGEIDPSSAEAASKDLSQAKWKSLLAQVGNSTTSAYRDTDFQFGRTYMYTVRSVTLADTNPVESRDSVPAIITPQDIYPPSVPQGLVAVVIVGNPTKPDVDLSWSISPETDLAGYRVYRSEQQETRGELVTPDLLLSPAYRDTSVQAAHRYWYRVTAVDRAGNESAASTPVVADVTQPSS
jgi:hypothetical protein